MEPRPFCTLTACDQCGLYKNNDCSINSIATALNDLAAFEAMKIK